MKSLILLMALMQNPDAQLQCAVAGCSSQLCVEASEAENTMSTCEWIKEYDCYKKFGICGTASNNYDNSCGWLQSPELIDCLNDAKKSPLALQ
jgi:hypothetical protein